MLRRSGRSGIIGAMQDKPSNAEISPDPAASPIRPDDVPSSSAVGQWKPEPDEEARAQTGGEAPKEIGGRDGPEPTRFGDWEKNGRCIDF